MNWPEWAPRRLTNFYDTIGASVPEAIQEDGSIADDGTPFWQRLETFRILCTDKRMEAIWRAIDEKTTDRDYHWDLAGVIADGLRAIFHHQTLTPKQFKAKREKARGLAKELRNVLAEMGWDDQTVFPMLGAKAMFHSVGFLLNGQAAVLPPNAKDWSFALMRLNQSMMDDAPGVGTWRDLLDRLATSMDADGKGWQDYRRVSGPDDSNGQAVNFAFGVDKFLREYCGCQLVPQVMTMTEIFFPDECRENRDAINIAVWRRGKHS